MPWEDLLQQLFGLNPYVSYIMFNHYETDKLRITAAVVDKLWWLAKVPKCVHFKKHSIMMWLFKNYLPTITLIENGTAHLLFRGADIILNLFSPAFFSELPAHLKHKGMLSHTPVDLTIFSYIQSLWWAAHCFLKGIFHTWNIYKHPRVTVQRKSVFKVLFYLLLWSCGLYIAFKHIW